MEATQLVALVAAAAVAGGVDAVAGGGGLITVPALLLTGLPLPQVLGTNKGQAVFGSAAALRSFWRGGHIARARVSWLFSFGFAGALVGAWLVGQLPPALLRPLVLVLLVAVAAVLALRPRLTERPRPAPAQALPRAALIAGTIGLYDGFFGPGTGTFLIVALALWLGDSLTAASAHAKVVNFGSNLAAVLLFAAQGSVLWQIALPMAVGQALGATLGARFAMRGGDRVVRRVVLVVVAALVAKLVWDSVR